MASDDKRQKFYDLCKKTMELSIEEFLTNPSWGDFNFTSCKEDIQTATKLINILQNENITTIPDRNLESISEAISVFFNALNAIKSFNINNNAEKNHTDIARRVSSSVENIVSRTAPWPSFLQILSSENINYADELEKRLTQLKEDLEIEAERAQAIKEEESYRQKELKSAIDLANSTLTDAKEKSEYILKKTQEAALSVQIKTERALQEARKVASQKAVAPFTHSFKETANDWDGTAHGWLVTTGVLLIATGLWAYHGLQGSVPALNQTTEIVQYFSARFLITALLISSIWWSAKQYRVARHQKTVNQHKADALRSFEAFIEATNSPDVRDAVILQTSQTIFGQQPTGYLDGNEESSFEQYTKVAQSINSAAHAITKNS